MVMEVGIQTVNANRLQQQQQQPVGQSPAQAQRQAEPKGNILPARQQESAKESRPELETNNLEKMVEALNQFMKASQRSLQFTLDSDTGRTVVRVINTETQEIVRQFPPDEILSLSKMITESLEEAAIVESTGVLLEEQG